MKYETSRCIFCNLPQDRILKSSTYYNIIKDGFPVTEGHRLIIPKRHTETWFDLTSEEHNELTELLISVKNELEMEDPSISGFNIGMNCGESAGQTVFHCHIHLIPRRKGDVHNPRGGVRGVIPERQQY